MPDLALLRASWRRGCVDEGTPSILDGKAATGPLLCLGEFERAVARVVAVRGLSPVAIAAAEDEGSFPVSSSLFILDLRSSNSDQTVEGAAVETVDSVATWSASRNLSAYRISDTILLLPDRVDGRSGSPLAVE